MPAPVMGPPQRVPSMPPPLRITRRSHTLPTACSPRASTELGSLSLASSAHLTPHGQAGGGSRPPGSAPLHRRPPSRPPLTPKSSAPRPPASCAAHLRPPAFPLAASSSSPWRLRRSSHHATGPPKIPARERPGLRFGSVVRVVAVARSRGHLRGRRVKSAYRFCFRKIR